MAPLKFQTFPLGMDVCPQACLSDSRQAKLPYAAHSHIHDTLGSQCRASFHFLFPRLCQHVIICDAGNGNFASRLKALQVPSSQPISYCFFVILLCYISMSHCTDVLIWEIFYWRAIVLRFTTLVLLYPPLYVILKCVFPSKLTKAIRNLFVRAIKGKQNRSHQYMDISEPLPFRLSNP